METKEIIQIVIAILLFTMVFGINDPYETFNLDRWMNHFFKIAIFATMIITTHIFGHKIVGKIYKVKADFSLWYFRFLAFTPGMLFTKEENQEFKGKFYIGPVLTFLIAVLSIGKLPILLFDSVVVQAKEELRIKKLPFFRQTKKYVLLRDIDEGVVRMGGILANVLLLYLVTLFAYDPEFYFMTLLYLFFAMLPIPGLDGGAIYEARFVYFSTLIFSALSLLLIYLFKSSLVIIFLLSLVITLVFVIWIYKEFEKIKGK